MAWQLLHLDLGQWPCLGSQWGTRQLGASPTYTPSTGWRPVTHVRGQGGAEGPPTGHPGRLQTLCTLCPRALWSQEGGEHAGRFVSGETGVSER